MKISRRLVLCVAVALMSAASAVPPTFAARTLASFAQPELKDLQVEIVVVSKNTRELAKMGKGYVDAYSKLKDQEVSFKEPNMVRFQAKHGIAGLTRITNGNKQLFSYLIHRKVSDITAEPGKADAIIDVGVITPGWENLVESEFLRTEQRAGKELHVFQVYFKADRKARHTLWLDPATRTVAEHIAHHRGKRKQGFKKRFVYEDVKRFGAVYLPTKATLYSSDNQPAAVMRYDNVRVNTGVSASRFRI